jgi:hypothetical protein
MKRIVYEGYRKDNTRNDSVGEGKMENRKEELDGVKMDDSDSSSSD